MGIDTPLQIGVLIAFGAFTAAIITAFVWYLLRSKSFPDLNPNRLNLTFLLLFSFAIAAIMSFLLFNAVASGETRSKGQVYSISQEPVLYWFLAVMYYSAAVAALSLGLVMAAKLIQPQRSLSDADFMKKALERVGESAGASSDSALDAESEMSDSPAKPLTRFWVIATIVYAAAMVLALYVYSRGDWGWHMPLPLPFAAFAPIPISLGLLAIYAGEFQVRNSVVYRSKNPIAYWLCVATIVSLGIFMFLGGIGIIGQ